MDSTRLLKHAVIDCYRHYPESQNYPVYVADMGGQKMSAGFWFDAYVSTSDAHSLPLPDMPAILIYHHYEEFSNMLKSRVDGKVEKLDGSGKCFPWESAPFHAVDDAKWWNVKSHKCRNIAFTVTLIIQSQVDPVPGVAETYLSTRYGTILMVRKPDNPSSILHHSQNILQINSDEAWALSISQDEPSWFSEEEGRVTCTIFGYINSPCQYKVITRSKDGFGQKHDGVREATRRNPIIHIIGYDRLYKEYESSPEAAQHSKSPHKRRGHWRYMWKEAGINRLKLPRDANQRHELAVNADVRRVYVKPAWIGADKFTVGDFEVEVTNEDDGTEQDELS